ncbi:MAG: cytochrome c maturation protein CcmE [Gammaproteobacteria bacterium]|nr:cytochrome c maturation protein CcmE [Gammaproteobacteria bacterium]
MHRQQKLAIVLFIISGSALAVGLVLFALNEGLNVFYTPTEVSEGAVPAGQSFRIGGMVKMGSLEKESLEGTEINFVATDFCNDVLVSYSGPLPDLFREGQGVVADGALNELGTFQATQILAKHDENYMSAEVKASLDAVEDADVEVCQQ